MTTYSSFFSSGLLAAPQTYDRLNSLPSIPSSPSMMSEALDDASDIDIERYERERSTTPTPFSLHGPTASITSAAGQQPRLRKRRSSLTLGTSSLNSIKSPMRNVNSAYQFQRHLQGTPSRVRSGSLSSVITCEEDSIPEASQPVVNEEVNKRRTRLRSGSIGTALKTRNIPARSIPRAMPPPDAPLPPLPPMPLSPTHAKSFSVPPNSIFGQKFGAMPPMPLTAASRQVLGELQP
ncbi:hypothetical protein K435DRAFT_969409 [Dendrothele bispora CBS 962.96]|uniref:Uncharacterized protein n=1 Tax=Dendrothele bispora (strain CBS 962.96) TaxID=1314807 RepID=A0A4S8LHU3_DENBC|nr:hypothetical protein K435DRAFT_969409 [Dendrothele bispora CBS 962.96]